MTSLEDKIEKQNNGIPLFKEKKVKDGWVLNLVKQNDAILSTSLYNPAGKLMENKVFLTQKDCDIEFFKEYLTLFEENPEKNYRKLSKIKSR